MKPSLFFRIHRFVYFLLRGIGRRENEHYLFSIQLPPIPDVGLYMILAEHGWQPNYLGFTYKGQIYQCRRLVDQGTHQYHVRCYDNGKVTGHFEITPEWDEQQHLVGQDLRTMTKEEAKELRTQLGASHARR